MEDQKKMHLGIAGKTLPETKLAGKSGASMKLVVGGIKIGKSYFKCNGFSTRSLIGVLASFIYAAGKSKLFMVYGLPRKNKCI
jgi:hypothetical protein